MALVDLCFEIIGCANLAGAQMLARKELLRLGEVKKPIAIVRPYSPDEDRRLAYDDEIGQDGLTNRERRIREAAEID